MDIKSATATILKQIGKDESACKIGWPLIRSGSALGMLPYRRIVCRNPSGEIGQFRSQADRPRPTWQRVFRARSRRRRQIDGVPVPPALSPREPAAAKPSTLFLLAESLPAGYPSSPQ